MMIFVAIICIGDGVLIGSAAGAAARSLDTGLIVGGISAGATWGIFLGIGTMLVRLGAWSALWRRYPCRDASALASHPRIISLALGHAWWQINNAVEARADDECLHLRIAIPTVGDDRPLSIPWEAVRSIGPASFGRAKLDVEGIALWVPRVLVKDELALREAMAAAQSREMAPEPEGLA